ncbi:dihydrodipicolinate synthase family protein [Novipirellula maiorica]|nr:dihydrodipicolinate synthase family protein [Rhodopirellula maiorica]
MPQLTSLKVDEIPAIRPRRSISGMSAILLPLLSGTEIDWEGFRGHVVRTADAGLVPAVNMDTGYANLITETQREQVLAETQSLMDGQPYVAGVFVKDDPGSAFDFDAYRNGLDQIVKYGGTPIIFQSYGLTEQADDEIVEAYSKIGSHAGDFLGFELGTMFAPFGKIYSLDVYKGLMGIETCHGAKHSSLSRELEWQRLQLRDETRPDFKVLTGNDLAIDMVMYGSDYLLGLSTFAPEAFARRDAMWAAGDAEFYELNDILQYLGFLAFRDPVPAYKHNAAQFLHARGWIQTPLTYPGSPERPESDVAILQNILERIS